MKHLNAAELLLLAEGELESDRAEHALSCSACQAASLRAESELGRVVGALVHDGPAESIDAKAESLIRLQSAMARAGVATPHLELEELLLHLDDELSPVGSEHLESCTGCHDELLRAQALLFDVEHELRALIPEESRQARLASASRLEKALDARRSRVLTFPAPWRAVYAVAALAAAGFFGLLWQAQRPVELPQTDLAQAPAVAEVAALPAAEAEVAATQVAASEESTELPVVAIASSEPVPAPPARFAPAPAEFVAPSLQAVAVLGGPEVSARFEPALWRAESLRGLELPRLERPEAAVMAAAPAVPTLIPVVPTTVRGSDRPVGGVVRTALVEHYTDAARRSFRPVRQDLLEGELARYVSEVLKADSELLRQAYALHELVRSADVDALDREAQKRLRAEARRCIDSIHAEEQQLYAKLSEALPRRYWATRGDRSEDAAAQTASLEATSQELLNAALALDRNISAVFVDADEIVRLQAEPASMGDLLFQVRSSSRNLQERLAVLR